MCTDESFTVKVEIFIFIDIYLANIGFDFRLILNVIEDVVDYENKHLAAVLLICGTIDTKHLEINSISS